MQELPVDWYALCAVTVLLGMKHGFDADHLAAIDALTRLNMAQRARLSRSCGALFSLGHGSVVMAIAIGSSMVATQWKAPPWLDPVGGWISICLLTALGLLNLQAVASAAPGQMVQPVGLRSRLFARALRAQTPLGVAMVGMLFAVSFDTLTQALLFSSSAMRFGGIGEAALLGLLFTTGMLITDGLNGLWIARLLARADRTAAMASRVMALTVALVTLGIAAFSATKLLSHRVSDWSAGSEMQMGFVVLVAVTASYCITRRFTRWMAAPSTTSGHPNDGYL